MSTLDQVPVSYCLCVFVGACDHHRARQTLQWDIACVFAVWASLAGSRPLGNGIGTHDRRLGRRTCDKRAACYRFTVSLEAKGWWRVAKKRSHPTSGGGGRRLLRARRGVRLRLYLPVICLSLTGTSKYPHNPLPYSVDWGWARGVCSPPTGEDVAPSPSGSYASRATPLGIASV